MYKYSKNLYRWLEMVSGQTGLLFSSAAPANSVPAAVTRS